MKSYVVKYLLILGIILFVVNISFSTTYAATNLTDIEGSYAKDAILELIDAGIINGTGEGTFDPTANISRQDFAIILAKALELDTSQSPATPTFSDVPTTHYSFQYVEAAVKAGLVKGIGNNTFGTGLNLTREQMATLFVRSLGIDNAGLGNSLPFSDAGSIAQWAKDSVGAAVNFGLMTGNSDNTFDPKGSAERQAVAQVASNFIKVKGVLNLPVNNPTPPEEEPAPPVNNPTPPVNNPTPPEEEPAPPVNNPTPPEEEPAPPVNNPAPPEEEPAPPVNNPTPPEEEPAPPVNNPTPPEEEPAPPVNNPTPPEEEPAPPQE